jgi:hypothetical protein
VLAPPGPIPNPVVTQRSAGEYCGGDPTGGEAAADTPHPRTADGQSDVAGSSRRGGETWLTAHSEEPPATGREPSTRRGVEQRQLVGLITQRSGVRIPPPLPHSEKRPSNSARSLFGVLSEIWSCYPKSPSCCTASCRRAAVMSVRTEIAGKNASNSAVLSNRSRNRSATSRSRRSR